MSEPYSAQLQTGVAGDDGALGDVIVSALQELLETLFRPIENVIETNGDAVLRMVVGTPHPDAVFSQPTNAVWPDIYEYYWELLVPLALSVYGLVIGLVIFLESTSYLFSSYHRSKLKKRAFTGLLGVLSWWWIAALSLRFMDALAGALVPSVADISLFQTLSFAGMGVLGTVISLSSSFLLFALIGLLYLARHLVLYLFVLLMPLLIVFWIPGVGPFTLVSKFMKRLAGFYVPFLFMTVPVVLLFRLGEILGSNFGLSAGEFATWVTALVIPFLAVLSPLVLFWQAGALFFVADRAARHLSTRTAHNRISSGRAHVQSATQGGRNFVRGVRDQPAVKQTGQYVLGSGDSSAHATGQRLNTAGSRLRAALDDRSVDSDGGNGGGGGSSTTDSSDSGSGEGGENGGNGFDRKGRGAIRDSPSREQDRDQDQDSDDDPPKYIH